MKNILFISDAFLGGGLETRIIEQIKTLKNHKIKPFLLCRELNPIYTPSFAATSDTLTLKPSSEILSVKSVLEDVETICNFCMQNKIDYIDCQPFWCALPSALAAEKLHIPISFTLHGEISANFIAKEHLAAQALYDTVFSYGFSQIFAVAEYLTRLYSYLPNIEIIRNGLPINHLTSKPFKNTKQVAIASRLDKPKTKLIIDFLPTLYSSKAISQIDIYGDGSCAHELQSYVANHHMTDKVNLCGWAKDFAKIINENQYMLVFGMGRVILEAMKSGVPAGVLGYGGFAGLVNHNNLLDFSKDNLTSWQTPPVDLSTELKKFFKNPRNYYFKSSQLSIFNIEIIWQKYYDIVSHLTYQDNPIIQSLYDSLSQNPSSNIFNDQTLFLSCIRILSDHNHPISPRLFYNVFQKQFDEINTLHQVNSKLQTENEKFRQQLPNRIRQKINHILLKNK